MQVKKQYEDYIIHYMEKGNLVSKLLKNLTQKEIDNFVAAKQHLKYFEPKINGKAKNKQAEPASTENNHEA